MLRVHYLFELFADCKIRVVVSNFSGSCFTFQFYTTILLNRLKDSLVMETRAESGYNHWRLRYFVKYRFQSDHSSSGAVEQRRCNEFQLGNKISPVIARETRYIFKGNPKVNRILHRAV